MRYLLTALFVALFALLLVAPTWARTSAEPESQVEQ